MAKNRVRIVADRIREALKSPAVVDGLAYLTVEQRRRHIRDGEGRDGQFEPIKPLEGRWKDSRGRWHTKQGYRNGGKPLRDTGWLMNSQGADGSVQGESIVLTLKGAHYGAYQNAGFTTKGPNFIPLTRKAARAGSAGAAGAAGGFRGRDFIIARRGVTVPARNFIEPTSADFHAFGRNIYTGLRLALKGR